jgi:hypothetical protein
MSMKMAKRVSKSRPWGLNRSPHEIELLGHISDHQTHWHGASDRPTPKSDACHSHSRVAMCLIQTVLTVAAQTVTDTLKTSLSNSALDSTKGGSDAVQ